MLKFVFCEEVSLLRKITITVDEGTLECLRAFREVFGTLILPLSGVLCGLIIKISFQFRLPIKNRPSVSGSAAEVVYYAL